MAIDAIKKNKLRSLLTLLGITIGVFSVIGVMTAIRTLESSVESGLNILLPIHSLSRNTQKLILGNPIKNIGIERILQLLNSKNLRTEQSCPFF